MSRPVPLPDRPRLLPGLRVSRRADGHLQVGLDPAVAMVVPDNPETREALHRLQLGEHPPDSPGSQRLYAALLARGLVVDGAQIERDLHGHHGWSAHGVSAAYAHADLRTPPLLALRAAAEVRVHGPSLLAEPAEELLAAFGVGGSTTAASPRVHVVVGVPELDRGVVDDLVSAGTPHVLVQLVDASVRVGPFVVPGVTACLRCVDAHESERDPQHPLVVEQYSHAGLTRADGVPEPLDPALAVVAMAWAVRDVVSYLDGEQPTTWSAGLRLGPGMLTEQRTWHRHLHCGCSWGEDVVPADKPERRDAG